MSDQLKKRIRKKRDTSCVKRTGMQKLAISIGFCKYVYSDAAQSINLPKHSDNLMKFH